MRAIETDARAHARAQNYHLGKDDHDLMLRAYSQLGLKSGRFLVGFYMPRGDGSSRRHRWRHGAKEWATLLMRRARADQSARKRAAAAIGARPNWNEDRGIPEGELKRVFTLCPRDPRDRGAGEQKKGKSEEEEEGGAKEKGK